MASLINLEVVMQETSRQRALVERSTQRLRRIVKETSIDVMLDRITRNEEERSENQLAVAQRNMKGLRKKSGGQSFCGN